MNEFYGFLIYILSFIFYAAYLVWTFIPSNWLQQCGIFYFPDKYWAIVLPNWIYIAMLWAFCFVFGLNLAAYPAEDSISYMLDQYSIVHEEEGEVEKEAMIPLRDLPLHWLSE